MPHFFHFLRGALGEPKLIETHKATIQRVLIGDYTPKNIEQLAGHHHVFSMRLGDAARLLFTTIMVNGKKTLLALDYLPNHEYHKSKFLRSKLCLEHYRQEAMASLSENDDSACEALFDEIRLQTDEALESIEMDYYQQSWLKLNTEQQHVLDLALPAVISGAAGSGKSCVALSLLQEHQLNYPAHPMLFITRSSALVVARQRDWLDLPISLESRVQFKTFDELVLDTLPKGWQDVGKEYFFEWYKAYVQIQSKIQKTVSKSTPYSPLDVDIVYEEFRIASGFSESAYCELGASQSLVEKLRRPEMFKALQSYRARLTQQQKYDQSFYQFPLDFMPFSLIVVDEAQDMSLGQAEQLFRLALNGKIVFCLDGHQRLFDRRSILPYLRQRFKIHEDSRVVTLPQTYRCAPNVSGVANEVLKFKHEVLAGKVDKRDYISIESRVDEMLSTGSVHRVSPDEFHRMPWASNIRQQANVVIITYPEFKEEVKRLFGAVDSVIYTPSEIKGLESEVVFTWKLCRPSVLKTIHLNLDVDTGKPIVNQAKQISEHEGVTQYLNEIYTAFTRAKTRLILCEEMRRENQILLSRVNPHLSALDEIWTTSVSTPKDWLEQVKKLWALGLNERAKNMYLNKLGSEIEFDELLITWACKPIVSEAEDLLKALPIVTESAALAEEMEKPSLTPKESSQALVAQSLEEGFSLALYEDFTERCLVDALNMCNLAQLFRLEHLVIEGARFSLLHFIQKNPTRTNVLFRVLANNLSLLCNKELLDIMSPKGLSFRLSQGFNQKRLLIKEVYREFNTRPNIQRLIAKKAPPLLASIQESLLSSQRILCNLGANLNLVDTSGNSMLHLYAATGNTSIVSLLISKGININQLNVEGYNPAHYAVRQGNLAILKILVQAGININQPDSIGMTPFLHAVLRDQVELLTWLARHGANVNHVSNDGRSALFFAAGRGNVSIVQKLIELKVDALQVAHDGWGPMHIAIQHQCLEVVHALDIAQVPLNQRTSEGYTPLFLAAALGHVDIVRFFLLKNIAYEPVLFTQEQLLQSSFNSGGNVFMRILNWARNYLDRVPDTDVLTVYPHDMAMMMGYPYIATMIEEFYDAKNISLSHLGIFAKTKTDSQDKQDLRPEL
jgi:hypothetical protein